MKSIKRAKQKLNSEFGVVRGINFKNVHTVRKHFGNIFSVELTLRMVCLRVLGSCPIWKKKEEAKEVNDIKA